MADQNKETSRELRSLAATLQKTTSLMRDNYYALRRYIYQELFLVFVLLFLFIICSRCFRIPFHTLLFLLILLLVIYLMGVVLNRIVKTGSSYRGYYREGEKTLQIMSDKAEWTRYKRRLIIKGSEIEVSQAIDDFFSVSDKLWSPTRVEKNYYLLLVTLLPIILLFTFVAIIIKMVFVI